MSDPVRQRIDLGARILQVAPQGWNKRQSVAQHLAKVLVANQLYRPAMEVMDGADHCLVVPKPSRCKVQIDHEKDYLHIFAFRLFNGPVTVRPPTLAGRCPNEYRSENIAMCINWRHYLRNYVSFCFGGLFFCVILAFDFSISDFIQCRLP